jgi:hypothetical protein
VRGRITPLCVTVTLTRRATERVENVRLLEAGASARSVSMLAVIDRLAMQIN